MKLKFIFGILLSIFLFSCENEEVCEYKLTISAGEVNLEGNVNININAEILSGHDLVGDYYLY